MAVVRAHVTISGRVQGVGFRFSTVRQAQRAGVKGWVRNLTDGRVEAVFEGTREAVEQVVGWCRKGPAFAHVDQIEDAWEEGAAEYHEFSVRR